jgi:hypothetical protein
MKTLGRVSVLFGAATVMFAAFAGQASAGEIYPWAPSPCGACDGCGQGYTGTWGYAYGPYVDGTGYHGPGCCGRLDYDRYIVGHGPMFPGGDRSIGYSYGPSIIPRTPSGPNTPPAPTIPPAPNSQ